MHDSSDVHLPVYQTKAKAPAQVTPFTRAFVVMGVVLDHTCTVSLAVRIGSLLGLCTCRCSLGPIAEFTSKCIHVIQAHHLAGIFLAAVSALYHSIKGNCLDSTQRRDADAAASTTCTDGRNADPGTSVALHLWCWLRWDDGYYVLALLGPTLCFQ